MKIKKKKYIFYFSSAFLDLNNLFVNYSDTFDFDSFFYLPLIIFAIHFYRFFFDDHQKN